METNCYAYGCRKRANKQGSDTIHRCIFIYNPVIYI